MNKKNNITGKTRSLSMYAKYFLKILGIKNIVPNKPGG